MIFYTINNKITKAGNGFVNFITDLENDYYLYKLDGKWVTVIDQETYDRLLVYTKEISNFLGFKRKHTRHRKCLNMVKSISEINIPDEIIKEGLFIVKREFGVWEEDLYISDTSSSGFKEIYLTKIKGYERYLLELKVTEALEKGISRKIYGKFISFDNSNSLKNILYNFVVLRCKIKKLKVPSINDLDFDLSYALAKKLGYIEDKEPINIKEVGLEEVKCRTSNRTSKYLWSKIRNDLSNTGYKYITMYKSKNLLFLSLSIKKMKLTKGHVLLNLNNETLDTEVIKETYKEKLRELLDTRCKIDDIDMIENVDYTIGIKFIEDFINEYSRSQHSVFQD